MSLVPLKTHFGPQADQALYAPYTVTGGGGGGGQNLVVSTIVLEGSTAPITATLPSAPNDGFEVRNGGGGNNVVVVATIDEDNNGQIEFGARTISTIGGNPVPIGRFEMTLDGVPTDAAALTYLYDKTGSGNASTIGSMAFFPGSAGAAGYVSIKTEGGTTLNIGNGQVQMGTGSALVPGYATVAASGNIYVPATGANQTVAQFSTVVGHVYELWIPSVRVDNQPQGTPAAGAWSDLYVDTTPNTNYLQTFDMNSISTINNTETSITGAFVATATGHNLVASASLANTLSTAMTFTPAVVYLRDLGATTSFQHVG